MSHRSLRRSHEPAVFWGSKSRRLAQRRMEKFENAGPGIDCGSSGVFGVPAKINFCLRDRVNYYAHRSGEIGKRNEMASPRVNQLAVWKRVSSLLQLLHHAIA